MAVKKMTLSSHQFPVNFAVDDFLPENEGFLQLPSLDTGETTQTTVETLHCKTKKNLIYKFKRKSDRNRGETEWMDKLSLNGELWCIKVCSPADTCFLLPPGIETFQNWHSFRSIGE